MAPRRSTRRHPQIHTSEQGGGMVRRRSPRLHPLNHASEEGAGVSRRRSPRLHPQNHASEEGAGATGRHSPRLRPQIHASEEGAGVTRRIGRRSTGTFPAAAAAASLPDNDDMLREILLRLPPQPSSLPRASAVCRRWRGLVTDPKFHRQFYAHHRKPPLLGFIHTTNEGIVFTPVLDPPNHIPPQRFDIGHYSGSWVYNALDCRHGLLLVQDKNEKEVVVCNLITRVQRRVAFPMKLRNGILRGAVLCAAAAADHVHGSCHLSPFGVVLVSVIRPDFRPLTCVYSSETGLWGDLISTEATCRISPKPVVLVANCLYWLSFIDGILEFDLDENRLTVIRVPHTANNIHYSKCQIIEADDGVIGFAELSYPRFQLWQRNVNAHGVATWVLWKTIEMHSVRGLPPHIKWLLLQYDEDSDVIFLRANGNIYKVQLKSMHSRKLYETGYVNYYRPFKSFYAPGSTIAGEFNGAELFHNA